LWKLPQQPSIFFYCLRKFFLGFIHQTGIFNSFQTVSQGVHFVLFDPANFGRQEKVDIRVETFDYHKRGTFDLLAQIVPLKSMCCSSLLRDVMF
jgi:hypothetical protein